MVGRRDDGGWQMAAVPAVVVALFAWWAGNFEGGATFSGATAGLVALLTAVAALGAAVPWRRLLDPLRLGRRGALLLWALLAAALLSWWLSPVPRAGRMGLLLAPAVVWFAAFVGESWRRERERRVGMALLALVVAGVAGHALVSWGIGATARPAVPLGHHNLLAAWLVTLSPLVLAEALVGSGEGGGAWRRTGFLGAGALGCAALLATRSLSGTLALAVVGLLAVVWLARDGRRGGRMLAPDRRTVLVGATLAIAVLALAVLAAPRVLRIARGADASAAARALYLDAGLAGLAHRPVTGHGPGSTAWTLAAHLRPVPGVSPPTEVVGELHLFPLTVAYELGLVGLALALGTAAAFLLARRRELASAPGALRARREPGVVGGLAGLAGLVVCGLGTGDWRIAALPLAGAVAAGVVLAGTAPPADAEGRADPPGGMASGLWTALAYCLLVFLLAQGPLRAQRAAERAEELFWQADWAATLEAVGQGEAGAAMAGRAAAVAALERAAALDPKLPLYRARLAALGGEDAVAQSRRAAVGADGVGAFWLQAGTVPGAPEEGRREALLRAAALDPLLPFAPFELALSEPHGAEAVRWAVRALAAAPELAAARRWDERPELLETALAALAREEGIDPGWRESYLEAVRGLEAVSEPLRGWQVGRDEGRGGSGQLLPTNDLALVVDDRRGRSLSLETFRRRPWRLVLAPVELHLTEAQALRSFPAATTLPGTDPAIFQARRGPVCPPQILWKTMWKSRGEEG